MWESGRLSWSGYCVWVIGVAPVEGVGVMKNGSGVEADRLVAWAGSPPAGGIYRVHSSAIKRAMDLAIAQMSEPDANGWCSPGLSCDFMPLAWARAKRRIATSTR